MNASAPQIPSIQTRASGGDVNKGQRFIARENCINEMVGRIGNRSAVANNDQTTEGIATAVDNAMWNVLAPALAGIGASSINISNEGDARGLFKAVQTQASEYYDGTRKSPLRG